MAEFRQVRIPHSSPLFMLLNLGFEYRETHRRQPFLPPNANWQTVMQKFLAAYAMGMRAHYWMRLTRHLEQIENRRVTNGISPSGIFRCIPRMVTVEVYHHDAIQLPDGTSQTSPQHRFSSMDEVEFQQRCINPRLMCLWRWIFYHVHFVLSARRRWQRRRPANELCG